MLFPPAEPAAVPVPKTARALLQVLPVGHILTATARRESSGEMMLVAGRLRLPPPQGITLRPGDAVALRITSAGGRRGLEILQREPATADAVTRLQRVHLPRQQALFDSFQTLHQIDSTRLPPAAARSISELLATLPQAQALTSPSGLRHALRDAGSLFESLLIERPQFAGEMAGRDLRAKLLRLAGQLRTAQDSRAESTQSTATDTRASTELTQAEQAVSGALSRQTLHQAQARTADGHVQLVFELPVRDTDGIDDFRLELHEDAPGETPPTDEVGWSVIVRLGFPEIGRLEARLRYTGEGLSINWQGSTGALREQLRADLPHFEGALARANLAVHGIQISEQALAPDNTTHAPHSRGLIDDQA